jgi:putative dehydrogenase
VLAGDYRPRSAVNIFVKDLGHGPRGEIPCALAAALQMFPMGAGSDIGGDDDVSLGRLYARVTGRRCLERRRADI